MSQNGCGRYGFGGGCHPAVGGEEAGEDWHFDTGSCGLTVYWAVFVNVCEVRVGHLVYVHVGKRFHRHHESGLVFFFSVMLEDCA